MTTRDPVVELLAFHAGIRAALDAFDDLAAMARLGLADRRRAAALDAFFAGPMRRHDAAEREDLLPALLAVPHPPRVERLLAACAREHDAMEAVLTGIVQHLRDVAGLRAEPDADALTRAARALREVLAPHLAREEAELFPLARLLLAPSQLDDVQRRIEERAGTARASWASSVAPRDEEDPCAASPPPSPSPSPPAPAPPSATPRTRPA